MHFQEILGTRTERSRLADLRTLFVLQIKMVPSSWIHVVTGQIGAGVRTVDSQDKLTQSVFAVCEKGSARMEAPNQSAHPCVWTGSLLSAF